MPKTWPLMSTAGDFLLTLGCASRRRIAQGWGVCCVLALARSSPWTASNRAALIWCTTRGKAHSKPLQSDKCSGELVLTPLKLINRIAPKIGAPIGTHLNFCCMPTLHFGLASSMLHPILVPDAGCPRDRFA